MTDSATILASVAEQLMNGDQVTVGEQKIPVRKTGQAQLRIVQFRLNGRLLEAIEQNPDKPSRWGKLAREKHQVVQFLDPETRKYVAVSVDGKVQEYGKRS